ncbi:Mor transcription activator family protein [Glaciecola sp. 1036]|uniref:Mor transcription activator family protein n=1 Tax=Alteromonadaceae TaxID=72275 RepID=UPI003D007B22
MNDNQDEFSFDDDFDLLLENLPEATADKDVAQMRYKQHLWELVLIIERRLQKEGLDEDESYKLACTLIAEIAHYEGGEMRYLPRGDKLKQELRNIEMFKLWHLKGWMIEKIHKKYCPELNVIQVYKILHVKRKEYLAKIQPNLL